MRMEVLSDAEAVAKRAAAVIAEEARAAVAARGRFLMAVSGGKTPWIMLRALANEDVPWKRSRSCRSMSGSRRRGMRTGT